MRRLPAVLSATAVVLVAGALVLAVLTPAPAPVDEVLSMITLIVIVLAFAGVGLVLATRLPHNRVGWLCLAIGACLALVTASSAVARWGLLAGTLPRDVCEWVAVPSAAWVVVTAHTVAPAARPARTPAGASSMTTHSVGSAPNAWAATR